MKKSFFIILKISITISLLIFLFKKTDFSSLVGMIESSNRYLLFASFFIFFVLNLFCLYRWQLLLEGLSINVSLKRVFLSYFSGQFFNVVFPSTIGGDAIRTLDIAEHTKKHSSGILATVFLDRLSGFFGLMTVLIIALFLGYRLLDDVSIFIVMLVFLAFMLFISGVMFSSRFFRLTLFFVPFKGLKKYLCKIHDASASYKKKKGVLGKAWIISVLVQGGVPLIYYLVARAFSIELPLVYFMIFVPIIIVFSVVPISIGGLGVRDTACVALFAKVGLTAEKAFVLSLAHFGLMMIIGLIGGVCYVVTLYSRRV